jgi:hypothetical protein
MLLVPALRSPLARQLSEVVRLDPVRELEVTETGFTLAGMVGTVFGFESGKFRAAMPRFSFALPLKATDKVKVRVATFPGTVSLSVIVLE